MSAPTRDHADIVNLRRARIALCSVQQDSAATHSSVNNKCREDLVRAKALFVATIAITALAAPLSAQARPFEDPRAAFALRELDRDEIRLTARELLAEGHRDFDSALW